MIYNVDELKARFDRQIKISDMFPEQSESDKWSGYSMSSKFLSEIHDLLEIHSPLVAESVTVWDIQQIFLAYLTWTVYGIEV